MDMDDRVNRKQTPSVSSELPYYLPQRNEAELFEYAFRHQLPVLIKGPTGCGKTRTWQRGWVARFTLLPVMMT
jgi:MoxR-like ATPase